jgi:hypothetical protein
MQFGSKTERAVWRNALLALIPDAMVAIVAAWVTSSGVVGFIITMIALQVLYFLIWAKNSGWLWVNFWIGGRNRKFHDEAPAMEAIKQYKIGCFYLWGASVPTWDKYVCLARSYQRIVERLKTPKPFIYRVAHNYRVDQIKIL